MPLCDKCGKPLTCGKCSSPVPVSGAVQPCPLKKGAIWVQVNDDAGNGLKGAKVALNGATKITDASGIAGFDPLDAGPYTVQLNPLDGALADYTAPVQMSQPATVVNGEIALVVFTATRPVNKVTGKLTLEYKVALLDRGLSAHQPGTETKLHAMPTYVQVSYTEDHKEIKEFDKGGTLVVDAGKVDLFEDKECTRPWPGNGAVSNAQLKAKQKIWLRGKGAGKFDLKLTLEDPADPLIKIQPDASEPFGVVELKLEVHEYPEAAPFTQAAMSDQDKVRRGRLLHLQSAKNDYARAKMILKKVEAAQWPGGCDAYVIVLKAVNASGSVKLWDAEENGAAKALPLEVKKADLGADKTYWVEGASNCTAVRGVRLGLALKDGGKEVKENADWANFTVAQIKSVKPSGQYPAESADYGGGNYRHFINVRPKAGGGWEATADARKIPAKAEVTPAAAGIKVHFMLIPDANNEKKANWGEDKPGTWNAIGAALKHLDRVAAGGLHLNADTDATGFAEQKDIKLSQFGGDKFKLGAFFSQDPHFREYKAGDAVKGKRKPVQSQDITLWRKLWFRMLREQNFNAPNPAAAVAAYERVKVVLTAAPEITFQATDGWVPARTFYPRSMIEPGKTSATDVAVIGSHNKVAFFGQIADDPDRPLEEKLIICQHQWDHRNGAALYTGTLTFTLRWGSKSVEMDESVFDPPLNGALVQTGTWETKDYPAGHAKHRSGNITAADLVFEDDRSNTRTVKIKLPPGTGVGLLTPILVTLKLKAAYGPYLGESVGRNILIVYNPSDVADYNDTVGHEIGHSINQTPRNGAQPGTVPNHPQQVDAGQGNHCTDRRCVMYASGPQSTAIHRYCEVCHPYILVEDLSHFV